MVLDLVAEVAADHVEQRAALDVRRAEELADVPAALGLGLELLAREREGLIWEVAAEDDRVRPHVADDVRREVRRERGQERGPAQQRPEDVVLDDLPPSLAEDPAEVLGHLPATTSLPRGRR